MSKQARIVLIVFALFFLILAFAFLSSRTGQDQEVLSPQGIDMMQTPTPSMVISPLPAQVPPASPTVSGKGEALSADQATSCNPSITSSTDPGGRVSLCSVAPCEAPAGYGVGFSTYNSTGQEQAIATPALGYEHCIYIEAATAGPIELNESLIGDTNWLQASGGAVWHRGQ